MNEQVPLPSEIWERTPAEAQALILRLLESVQQLRERIVQQEQRNTEQEKRIASLEERLKLDSNNSSKPPSTDPPSVKQERPPKKSKKKRGGQPGHKGHHRELVPLEQVNQVIVLKPEVCEHCQTSLAGEDDAPQRHQVTELPPIQPIVTEYQQHRLTCPKCGKKTRAKLPPGVPTGCFGPRFQATLSLLSGVCLLPKRMIEHVADVVFGTQVGLGSVCALEERTAEALESPYQEAHQAIKQSTVCHLDETGWKINKQRSWLWVATTALVTVFLLSLSRGSKVAKQLVEEEYKGLLVTDRWCAYNWFDPKRRQLCWSHLLREFEKWTLRKGESTRWGQHLLLQTRRLFHWWHRIRDGTLSKRYYQARMRQVRSEVEYFLERASKCDHEKTAATARQLLKQKESLWTFLREEGVEPTNNAAERALRPAVIWRKRCFGSDSEKGKQFVERILTVAYTLKQQKRDVLEYLTAAIKAHGLGQPPPSLLPLPHSTP